MADTPIRDTTLTHFDFRRNVIKAQLIGTYFVAYAKQPELQEMLRYYLDQLTANNVPTWAFYAGMGLINAIAQSSELHPNLVAEYNSFVPTKINVYEHEEG